jgi:hypothetical protein
MIAEFKRIFVFILNSCLFYVKAQINNEITIQTISDTDLHKTLKNIVVGCDDKSVINVRIIFESDTGPASGKNFFLIGDVSFYNQESNVLNLLSVESL